MNLLHAIVHHQTFGQGEVIQVSDDFVSVSFPQPHGEKKFQYPAAFSSHLTIEDDSIKSEMAEVLRQSHLQIEAEEQRVGRAWRNSVPIPSKRPISRRKQRKRSKRQIFCMI